MSTQAQVQTMHNDYRDQLILQRYQASGGDRPVSAVAAEFGVSQLHVIELVREAQLAAQREDAQDTAHQITLDGEVLWAVPARHIAYRTGCQALCAQVREAEEDHPDQQVLLAVCIAPTVEHIRITQLPVEPQPERLQTAAVTGGVA